MNILILTGYDRNMAELAELCLPSKLAWADRHGDFLLHLTGIDRSERVEVARRFIAEHVNPAEP